MRSSYLSILLVSAISGCGGAAAGDPTDSSTGETTGMPDPTDPAESSGAPVCIPGYEGCPCHEGLCLGGLQCLSDLCVEARGETSLDPESTDPMPEESSSSGTPSSESSSSDGSSSESSTTMVVPECTDGETTCEDEQLTTCVEAMPVDAACDDVCAPNGYSSSGCADAESCACDEALDENCETAVVAFCFCVEYFEAGSCTAADIEMYYSQCFMDTVPEIECFGSYVSAGQVDCEAAANGCL